MRPGIVLLLSALAFGGGLEYSRAHDLYLHTNYRESLAALSRVQSKDSGDLKLAGQNYFMLGDYPRALDAFTQALSMAATNAERSELYHWLGKTHGRLAEKSGVFSAPGHASKARVNFEQAVRLDPTNQEAVNDLFDYYLEAPGFLGGGMDKAEKLAGHIAMLDVAEGHFAQAQLSEKRHQYDQAEYHLRQAAELEPNDAARWVDVAKFLARRGKLRESDAAFDRAAAAQPGSPQLLFARAEVYSANRYRLDDARMLLSRYLQASLTPEDPPKERARAMLEKLK